MAKSGVKKSRGGKLTRSAQTTASIPPTSSNTGPVSVAAAVNAAQAAAQQQPPVQQPTPQQQPTPAATPSQTPDFTKMSDTQFAAMVSNLRNVDMPNFLNRNDQFQQFVYANNVNSKPLQEDPATFAKNSRGKVKLWRTVNQTYDSRTDVGMNADQITKQFMDGTLSRTGDGVYGQGYYFADSRRSSVSYGYTPGNVKQTAVMNAYINGNAKIGNYTTLNNQLYKEMNSGSAIGNALKRIGDKNQAISIYAMRKGYNVIDVGRGTGYYVILDRSALTVNTAVTAK